MKKVFLLIPILIFLFAGCDGKKVSDLIDTVDTDSNDTDSVDADTVDPNDPTDSSTDQNDSDSQDTEIPDKDSSETETSDSTDTETHDSETSDNENPDSETPDSETPDSESPDNEDPDSEAPDSEAPDNENPDSETPDSEAPDSETPDNENPDTDSPNQEELADVFNPGPYEVKITDIASGTDGAPRDFRIYEPKNASGNIPVVHFQHGYKYKPDYYDNMLSHITSHGFIVVSGKSDHTGETSIKEAENVETFINWLKTNIQSKVSVTADVENFGVAGHDRGGKVTSRLVNRDLNIAKGFFGVDPIDSNQSSSFDPATVTEITTGAISSKEQCEALGGTYSVFGSCKNVTIDSQEKCEILGGYYFNGSKCYNNRATLPSMFLGTEKGESGSSACAPSGENSFDFYANYPSPSHHIVAAGAGHTDMVDPEDFSSCGSICSNCSGSGNAELNQQLIRYAGGLMVAFFNSTLKDQTQYEALINDSSLHPFATTLNEHK